MLSESGAPGLRKVSKVEVAAARGAACENAVVHENGETSASPYTAFPSAFFPLWPFSLYTISRDTHVGLLYIHEPQIPDALQNG